MNILRKLALRNLKLNKKRTISTIIGIILSTALICAVATMATSLRETLVQNAINETGYYHIKISNINNQEIENLKNNRDVKDIYSVNNIGYGLLENSKNEYKPYLKLFSMEYSTFEKLKLKLIKGKFPQNNNEIVISKYINTNAEMDYKIGDKIKIGIGDRKTKDGYELKSNNLYDKNQEILDNIKEYEFTIVGIIERPDYSFENYSDPGYTIITTNIEKETKEVYLSLKKPSNYKEDIAQLLGASNYDAIVDEITNLKFNDFEINNELLRWEVFAFNSGTMNMLYSVCGVVIFIIIFTSVFCIRNSFAISITEKIKMYGMLSSIGATKKQIKKNVLIEALILGGIGIPLGIISGIFASFVLIKITNILVGDQLLGNINGMIFKTSFLAILLSSILGLITIYLSARGSAKKASKITPIECLRNTNEINIKSKKLKTPIIINKIFGTGGVLAYKNLKRSRKKYRTTVISLVVSISIFIIMSSFINYAFGTVNLYYNNYDYNIVMTCNSSNRINQSDIDKINSLDYIQEKHYAYYSKMPYIITDIEKVDYKESIIEENDIENEEYVSLTIIALDKESFKKYAEKIGANYEKIKDKVILSDTIKYIEQNGKTIEKRIYNYKKNDTINGKYKSKEYNMEIGAITNIMPYGYEEYSLNGGAIIVNYDVYKDIFDFYVEKITIQSDNPEKLVKEIENLNLDMYINNYDEMVKSQKSIFILMSIFLYGFITVITLIGVTNIFNTITSNIELRQKEFAMLKSIGMTKKEFNKMVNLETIFYSLKSLMYGIILGLLGSFAMYKSFAIKLDKGMYIPYQSIIISALGVFVLVYIIMKYSIKKINKQNTIETIRKENI